MSGVDLPAIPLPEITTSGNIVWYELISQEDTRIEMIRSVCNSREMTDIELKENEQVSLEDAFALITTSVDNTGQLIVSTIIDENDGDYSYDDFSLREALVVARETPGDNVIVFSNDLNGGIVTLDPTLGQLVIDSNVDIQGLGIDKFIIDAANNMTEYEEDEYRVFSIMPGVVAHLSGMTITRGKASGEWGRRNKQ